MCRSVNHQDEKSNNFLRVYPSLIFNVYIWQGSSYPPRSETTCMLNNVAKLQSIKILSSLDHPAEQSTLVKSADFLQLFSVTVCRRQILMHHFFSTTQRIHPPVLPETLTNLILFQLPSLPSCDNSRDLFESHKTCGFVSHFPGSLTQSCSGLYRFDIFFHKNKNKMLSFHSHKDSSSLAWITTLHMTQSFSFFFACFPIL